MKNRKLTLALDLGTTTGWALGPAGILSPESVTYGFMSFKTDRYSGGGMRFLRFRKWLQEMRELSDGFEAVVFEEVRRHMSTDAAHVYGGFLSHLTALCEEWDTPYRGIPVQTIKKYATGKGNASKDDMIVAMKKLGFHPQDDNVADALAILGCHGVEG